MKNIEQMTDEEKSILLFSLLGYRVSPWTEAQQIAYLLGVLQCPEGHVLTGESIRSEGPQKKQSRWLAYEVFPDVIFKEFINNKGQMYPDGGGEETREFEDSWKWTVLSCGGGPHEHASLFCIPPGILEDLKRMLSVESE